MIVSKSQILFDFRWKSGEIQAQKSNFNLMIVSKSQILLILGEKVVRSRLKNRISNLPVFEPYDTRIRRRFCAAIEFSKKFRVFLPGNAVAFGILNQGKQENFF